MQNCIIVDIDGTIAHKGDRSPFRWDKVGEDTVNEPVVDLIRNYKYGYDSQNKELTIVLVSGRDSVCRRETSNWLDEHIIPYDFLFMRTEGDKRKDSIIKEEIYREHIEGKLNVLFVLDDRSQTVKKWRELGLTCIQVAPGNF